MVESTAIKGHFFKNGRARRTLARKGGLVRSRNLLITDGIAGLRTFQNLPTRMANAMLIILAYQRSSERNYLRKLFRRIKK